MTKQKTIAAILEEGKIHHNIAIKWSKMPEYDEAEGYDWNNTAEDMCRLFVDDWNERKINDTGNRNLQNCVKENHTKTGNGACLQHDIWNVYTCGRSGATIYWTKYWKESHLIAGEYDLQQMSADELKTMLEEMATFNDAVKELMLGFYSQSVENLEYIREEKKAEEKAEKAYQKIAGIVKKENYLKRLINDII